MIGRGAREIRHIDSEEETRRSREERRHVSKEKRGAGSRRGAQGSRRCVNFNYRGGRAGGVGPGRKELLQRNQTGDRAHRAGDNEHGAGMV